jgi:hypothetical protein
MAQLPPKRHESASEAQQLTAFNSVTHVDVLASILSSFWKSAKSSTLFQTRSESAFATASSSATPLLVIVHHRSSSFFRCLDGRRFFRSSKRPKIACLRVYSYKIDSKFRLLKRAGRHVAIIIVKYLLGYLGQKGHFNEAEIWLLPNIWL